AGIRRSVSTKRERAVTVEAAVPAAESKDRGRHARRYTEPKKMEDQKKHVQKITVPIMGEGIRNAKIVSLLKKPGDRIALDDDLCEVETDKAVYPIQSSFGGIMGEWKTKVGDTVEIGQELGTIVTAESSFADQFQEAADESVAAVEAAVPSRKEPEFAPEDRRRYKIEPALSPTIVRKLV